MAGAPWLRCRLPGFAPEALAERAAAEPDAVDLYRAGLVLPVTAPPIVDGALAVRAGRILAVGPARALLAAHPTARCVAELPDAVLLPGLVNAHCHLALSLAQGVLPPSADFVAWIRHLLALRRSWTEDEQRLSLAAGLRETLRGGCTLIGDILSENEVEVRHLLAELAPPLTVRGYHELLGWEPAARERALVGARAALAAPPPTLAPPGALLAGLSPHAPYSSHPALVEACFALARERGLPLAIHLAETEAERRYLDAASGPFAELQARLGWTEPAAWSAAAPKGLVEWLAGAASAAPLLIVHGTWLEPAEIARLTARPATSVAYCPGSVAWFHDGADPHPVAAMLAAGLPVALGTDSLASSPTLNLPLTCTLAQRAQPALGPEQLLWMATRAGALALGCPERGELAPGGPADFVIFDLAGGRRAQRSAIAAIEGALLSGYRVPSLSVLGGIPHAFAALRPFPV